MLASMGAGESGSAEAPSYATYTFLFTDVEGSTRRWEADPAAMNVGLAAHDKTLTATVQAHRGTVFKRSGDGVHAVFSSATDAVRAAVVAQRQLVLPVRMGIHSGEAVEREGDYFGTTLNRCARPTMPDMAVRCCCRRARRRSWRIAGGQGSPSGI